MAKKQREMLLVRSKIKSSVDHSVAGDVPDTMNELIHDMLAKAGDRATANGRRTIQSKDF